MLKNLLTIVFSMASILIAGENNFYHGQQFGSELAFNPLTTMINGGFGIVQISNRSNKFSDIDFRQGYKNVKHNLTHPFSSIADYGWGEFINTEILPTSLNTRRAQYFPNYSLHLIGGGATLVMFREWYDFHRYPNPTILAYGSWMIYHLLNEVVENSGYSGLNVDPISDVYIFNTAGALLFSNKKFAHFWGNTLHLRDWSFIPSVNPDFGTIENVGQNFVIKYNIPKTQKWSLFYHFGVHGAGGLSYNYSGEKSFSCAAGLVADELVSADELSQSRVLTTDLVWTLGFFYDRNNSLLASLILAGTKGYKARLNLYPGLFKMGRLSPGLFVNLREDNQVVAGLSFSFFPIGLAHRL
jgi:hypothetical protein